MAQITKYTAQQLLDGDAGGMPQPRLSNALGEALQGFGGAISNFAEVAQRKAEQHENFKTESNWRKMQMQLGQDMALAADQMAPDGAGFHDAFMEKTYMPARDKFLAGVPERLRPKFEALLANGGENETQWSINAAGKQNDQQQGWYKQEIAASQQQLATAISQDPQGYENYLKLGMDEIDSSGLPTAVKQEQRAAWEHMAQVSHLNRRLEQDPEGVLRDLGADPRYLSPTTQFDSLKKALVVQESGGDTNAISPKGAIGLMQVMPGTAIDIAKEIKDPNFNPNWTAIEITQYLSNPTVNQRYGDYYLKKQIRTFAGRGGLEAALVAYNGGPKRAEAWIKSGFDDSVLPAETRNYYKEIMARLPGMKGAGKSDPKSVRLEFGSRGGISAADAESHVNPDLVGRVKSSFAALGLDRVRITSGFRSKQHNEEVGGAKGSQHVHGNAMDIDVRGYSTAERVQIINTLSANGITGLGIGANIIHADLGGRRAWGYKTAAGGGAVPKWAQAAIEDHLAGKARTPTGAGVGLSGRYASLPYNDRQNYIVKADNLVTARYNEQSKATAVQRVELKTSMENELASIRASGESTGKVEDTQVSTVLGEDDYVKWIADKRQAQRLFNARDGIGQMTVNEMDDRLQDYEPTPGSATYADDVQVRDAVQKEIDRVTKQRANAPDKAAMTFPDVKDAYEKVQGGLEAGNLNPDDTQAFVKLMLERQKDFNLKPGSEAPIPKDWAMEIGRSLARIPELAGGNSAAVNAAILAQYSAFQEAFGPYADEVILYALSEYKGVGKNTGELITAYMQAIQAGGDPFKLKPSPAEDRDAVEESSWLDRGWSAAKDFWYGERDNADSAAPDDPGPPEPTAPPSQETILRVVGALNGVETPEEEADIVARYGQAAVDAAKRRIEGGRQ